MLAVLRGTHRAWGRVASSRQYSTANVGVAISDDRVATVTLGKAPVNSLSKDFMGEVDSVFKGLNEKGEADGVIVTSSRPNVFSAGLDINAMYQATPESFDEFWRSLQKMWTSAYGSRLPTVAAITGHAPAGGCIIGMCCDYRVMGKGEGKYRIGLNETQLGIVAPDWAILQMERIMGPEETKKACDAGTLFTAEQALSVNLVDEIVDTQSEVLQRANVVVRDLIGDPSRVATLKQFRAQDVGTLNADLSKDVATTAKVIFDPTAQENMGKYLASLKKK